MGVGFRNVLVVAMMVCSNGAWAQAAPPSSMPPSSLPPLPKEMVVNINPKDLPPLPKDEDSSVPTSPTAPAGPAVYNAGELTGMLQTEVKRLANAVAPVFTVVLLPTNDPLYKTFVSTGLMKMTPSEYARHDYGLAGMMVQGGKVNTTTSDVCYILFDPDRGEQLWKSFIVPLSAGNHPQTGAAWVIGHEVGHCLDQRERNGKINSRLRWTVDDVAPIGLWPNAVRKAYGTSFSKDAFLTQPWNLYQYPSQQQYGERVADAFATFWTLKLGADPKLIGVAKDIRSRVNPAAPHFTAPVFDVVKENASYATRQARVDVIWDIARNVQKQVGVSAEADGATPNSGTMADSGPTKAVRWIVTSRGPVPVDMYGNIIPQTNNLPASQNFNSLPRFGK